MEQPKLISTPFADTGDKNEIPEAPVSVSTNRASLQAGFPPITGTPPTSGGLPPLRADFNGIFNLLSQHTVFQNKGGFYKFNADFATEIGGYPKGAVLMDDTDSKLYLSLVDGNTYNFNTTPTAVGQYWKEIDVGGADVSNLMPKTGTNLAGGNFALSGGGSVSLQGGSVDITTQIGGIGVDHNGIEITTLGGNDGINISSINTLKLYGEPIELGGSGLILSDDMVPADGDSSNMVPTTKWVMENAGASGSYMPIAGGTFTGTVSGVTPPAGDNSTKLATTAWVNANVSGGGASGDYLPLAGGQMTGAIVNNTTNGVFIQSTATPGCMVAYGGTAFNTGATLWLNGSRTAGVGTTYEFCLTSRNGSQSLGLLGHYSTGLRVALPDRTLSVPLSGNPAVNQRIMSGTFTIVAGSSVNITFPSPFINTPLVFWQGETAGAEGVTISNITLTGCTFARASGATGSSNFRYFAIG